MTGASGSASAQALELPEGEDDGGVGGTHRVEEVAGYDDGVGPGGDDTVDGQPKGLRDIGLALVDAGRVCRWYCRMPRWGSAMCASFTL